MALIASSHPNPLLALLNKASSALKVAKNWGRGFSYAE